MYRTVSGKNLDRILAEMEETGETQLGWSTFYLNQSGFPTHARSPWRATMVHLERVVQSDSEAAMGFKVRKSIKIAPGVRLNVSSKNLGLSAGVRGARVSVNTNGRVTRTVGIPGTGISHTSTSSSRGTRSAPRPKQPSQPVRAPKPKKVKPGLTAPAWEKQLFKHIQGEPDE